MWALIASGIASSHHLNFLSGCVVSMYNIFLAFPCGSFHEGTRYTTQIKMLTMTENKYDNLTVINWLQLMSQLLLLHVVVEFAFYLLLLSRRRMDPLQNRFVCLIKAHIVSSALGMHTATQWLDGPWLSITDGAVAALFTTRNNNQRPIEFELQYRVELCLVLKQHLIHYIHIKGPWPVHLISTEPCREKLDYSMNSLLRASHPFLYYHQLLNSCYSWQAHIINIEA